MSDWIQHIKAFAAKNNLSYGAALKNPECSSSYKAVKGSGLATNKVLDDPQLMNLIQGFVPVPKKKSIYKEREFKKIFKMPVQYKEWFNTYIADLKSKSKEEKKKIIQDNIVSAIETYVINDVENFFLKDKEKTRYDKVKKIYKFIKDTNTAPLALLKIITAVDDETQTDGIDYDTWKISSFPGFRYFIMSNELLPITDRETKKLLATL